MASVLELTIAVSAAAGGAMSVFGNLKGTMQRVAAVTKELKAKQGALGKTIQAAAALPQGELARLNAQFEKQRQILAKLKASTIALGMTQSRIAANEANRAALRGKMMETVALGYALAVPIKVAVDAEEAFADVKKVVDERVPELEAFLLDASRRIPKSFAGFAQIASGGAQGGIVRDELEKYIDLVAKMSVAGDIATDLKWHE
ncbi:MAG: phage tail tape measure protein [Candidatus Accumulibacter sp.]|jgi:hypothetical protein|nr:phage tail tape measure protein [Accumulibacter sp.]